MLKTTVCLTALLLCAMAFVASSPTIAQDKAEDDGFVSIFNGKDLTGWTPKIKGLELGEDPKQTFRVKDGVMQVRYENYEKFDRAFGHLFYESGP